MAQVGRAGRCGINPRSNGMSAAKKRAKAKRMKVWMGWQWVGPEGVQAGPVCQSNKSLPLYLHEWASTGDGRIARVRVTEVVPTRKPRRAKGGRSKG